MRIIAIIIALSSSIAHAEGYRIDAFGLVAHGVDIGERQFWSGKSTPAESLARPDEPDRVLIVSGPKSLVAGKDKVHVVSLTLDRHGNLVADNEPANLRIGEKNVEVLTRHGIAGYLHVPPPIAREIVTGAAAGQIQSSRAMIRVVPDIDSIEPEITTDTHSFTYEAFLELPATRLTDKFGNIAADGTNVAMNFEHANGTFSLASAIALHGRAELRFLSRDFEGETRVSARLGANTSRPRQIFIRSGLPDGDPRITFEPLPTILAQRVTVGPFLTSQGYTLGDGANVVLDVIDRAGKSYASAGWTLDGSVLFLVPIADAEDIDRVLISSPLGQMDLSSSWMVPRFPRQDFAE